MITREEFIDLKTTVAEVTRVVNNLNRVIVKNATSVYSPQVAHVGPPLLVTAFSTPRNSPVTSPKSIMKKFNSPLGENPTSPPSSSENQKQSKKLKDEPHFGRKLFNHKIEGNSSACYLNFNPMNTPLYDGRSSGITIPDCIPVVFRPPQSM
ncbi:unnamed protein product, partial [Cuscuta epithymum]